MVRPKPKAKVDVVKILLGYKDELRKREPDGDWKVEIIRDRGWILYPSQRYFYCVELRVTAPGYRIKTPTLSVGTNGGFSIR